MVRPRSLFVPLAFFALGIVSVPVHALTTWSGPASPCGSTLQNCINAVPAGEVLQVATNVPINEDLTIDKSLTLTAAPGFSPSLSALHFVQLLNPNPSANSIRFEHFTLARGMVMAIQASPNTFDVGIQFVSVHNTFNGLPPIEVRTPFPGSFGPMQVGIVGNHVMVPAASQPIGAAGIRLEGGQSSSLTGLIQRNVVEVFQGGQEPAIGVYNTDGTTEVTVVGNEIRGDDYNDGVLFFQFGNGSSHVRILDNLVVGQTTDSGAPGAYVILADGGNTTFEIVNNTAADSDNGILVTGRDDKGATWNGVVANNIVANMSGFGIVIGQPTESAGFVDNDHNLTFNVGSNFFVPGPGTLSADPLFFGGGNYRLTDPSPARNAGNDAHVPVDFTTDLDGNPRQVHVVDLGAYESSSLVGSEPATAEAIRLEPNAPNPFDAATTIRYALPHAGRTWLGVYDARGRLVRWLVTGQLVASGPHAAQWDGRDAAARAMPAGVYFYRLMSEGRTLTRRMVLLP